MQSSSQARTSVRPEQPGSTPDERLVSDASDGSRVEATDGSMSQHGVADARRVAAASALCPYFAMYGNDRQGPGVTS
jgi:hypothetical protein